MCACENLPAFHRCPWSLMFAAQHKKQAAWEHQAQRSTKGRTSPPCLHCPSYLVTLGRVKPRFFGTAVGQCGTAGWASTGTNLFLYLYAGRRQRGGRVALGSTSPGSLQWLCVSGCPGKKVSCSQGQKVDESHWGCSPTGESSPVSRRTGRCEGSQKSSAGQTQELDRAAGNRKWAVLLPFFFSGLLLPGRGFRLSSS